MNIVGCCFILSICGWLLSLVYHIVKLTGTLEYSQQQIACAQRSSLNGAIPSEPVLVLQNLWIAQIAVDGSNSVLHDFQSPVSFTKPQHVSDAYYSDLGYYVKKNLRGPNQDARQCARPS